MAARLGPPREDAEKMAERWQNEVRRCQARRGRIKPLKPIKGLFQGRGVGAHICISVYHVHT